MAKDFRVQRLFNAFNTDIRGCVLLMLSGLYVAGLLSIHMSDKLPAIDQRTTHILFAAGSMFVALTILCIWLRKRSSIIKAPVLLMAAVAVSALSGTLIILASMSRAYQLEFIMLGVFFCGGSIILNVLAWALAFKLLNYRTILFVSALSFALAVILCSVNLFLYESHPHFAPVLSGTLLIVGSCSLLLSRKEVHEGSTETLHAPDDSRENVSLLRVTVSIPVLGIATYAITAGVSFANNNTDYYYRMLLYGCIACVLVLITAVILTARLSERKVIFIVYGIWVPALAGISIILKVIPLDYVSSDIFREFMLFYFQVLIIAAWAYIVSLIRLGSTRLVPLCVAIQIIISLSLLIGLAVQAAGFPYDMTTLGLATAGFLLYAIIKVGNNIILYTKGTESVEELTQKPLNIESACAIVCTEYKLTPRECEVLNELAYGHSSSYVAKLLFISNNTARTHMKNIYRKLDINSREDLLEMVRERQREAPEP